MIVKRAFVKVKNAALAKGGIYLLCAKEDTYIARFD